MRGGPVGKGQRVRRVRWPSIDSSYSTFPVSTLSPPRRSSLTLTCSTCAFTYIFVVNPPLPPAALSLNSAVLRFSARQPPLLPSFYSSSYPSADQQSHGRRKSGISRSIFLVGKPCASVRHAFSPSRAAIRNVISLQRRQRNDRQKCALPMTPANVNFSRISSMRGSRGILQRHGSEYQNTRIIYSKLLARNVWVAKRCRAMPNKAIRERKKLSDAQGKDSFVCRISKVLPSVLHGIVARARVLHLIVFGIRECRARGAILRKSINHLVSHRHVFILPSLSLSFSSSIYFSCLHLHFLCFVCFAFPQPPFSLIIFRIHAGGIRRDVTSTALFLYFHSTS